MALLALVVPLFAESRDVTTKACTDAKLDAQIDINTTLWMGAGCLFGLLGVGAAYVIEPSPPASRLLGKSAEYVAIYTDCYKEEGKSIQTKAALKGCVVGTLVAWALYLALSPLIAAWLMGL
ncbi:hypothetical protein J7K99_06115 [bacterium]|nr:hypothetical protein [bacterium]